MAASPSTSTSTTSPASTSDAVATERQRAATWRHLEHVNALLDRREELRGVVPLADVLRQGSLSAA